MKRILAATPVAYALPRLLKPIPLPSLLHAGRRRVPVAGRFTRHLPSGRPISLWSDGYDAVMTQVFWDGVTSWEPGTMQALPSLLRDATAFLDIGASSGIYGLFVASEFPSVQVYCFEPFPPAFRRLERNAAANRLDNLTVERLALTRSGGTAKLYATRHQLDASMLAGYRQQTDLVEVQSSTVDDYVTLHGIRGVDVIKIDTEGTEPEVFAGARHTIARDLPTIVCEVLSGLTEEALEETFGPLGYQYFLLADEGPERRARIIGEKGVNPRNHLFVHESKLDTVAGALDKAVP